MLQDVYDILLMRRLDPRWVGRELHIDVCGRAFVVADYPGGVAIRKRQMVTPDDKVFAQVCRETDQALAALGL